MYASRYTRVEPLTASRPRTVMSFSSERPRPITYNIVDAGVVRKEEVVRALEDRWW